MTPSVWIVLYFLIACVFFVVGAGWGRWSMGDTINYLDAALKGERRFAGKLGDRIGRQRRIINELKGQLKTISKTTPAMAKPTNRPNLPH